MKRYIGKIKKIPRSEYDLESQNEIIVINNPHPIKEDGTEDKYHKGMLVWIDENGEYYQVLKMNVSEIPEEKRKWGYEKHVTIDIDREFCIKRLEKE